MRLLCENFHLELVILNQFFYRFSTFSKYFLKNWSSDSSPNPNNGVEIFSKIVGTPQRPKRKIWKFIQLSVQNFICFENFSWPLTKTPGPVRKLVRAYPVWLPPNQNFDYPTVHTALPLRNKMHVAYLCSEETRCRMRFAIYLPEESRCDGLQSK